MAGDAEHGGERIERGECRIADRRALRQQDIERCRGRADVDDPQRHLSQGDERARHPEIAEDRSVPPAHPADPDEVDRQRGEGAEADQAIGEWIEVVDFSHRVGSGDEADADDESHAQPECDAGDHGQACDLSRRQAGGRIEPVADRAARHQRESQGERDGVAGERGERGQPVGNLDPQMPERQAVVAGQGEIAQRSEGESQSDLVAAGRRDRRLELADVDMQQRAHEDGQRDADDEKARRQSEPPQSAPSALEERRSGPRGDWAAPEGAARSPAPGPRPGVVPAPAPCLVPADHRRGL